jgi:hypothetical protein
VLAFASAAVTTFSLLVGMLGPDTLRGRSTDGVNDLVKRALDP